MVVMGDERVYVDVVKTRDSDTKKRRRKGEEG